MNKLAISFLVVAQLFGSSEIKLSDAQRIAILQAENALLGVERDIAVAESQLRSLYSLRDQRKVVRDALHASIIPTGYKLSDDGKSIIPVSTPHN